MEGTAAPVFVLPANGEKTIDLAALLATKRNVVLYFYPKDSTPGCVVESKDFRDAILDFQKLETEIIGISADTVKSHDKFAEECQLPFLLASDSEHIVCKQYGVWQEKSFMGKKFMGIVRSTFLINKNGIIHKVWRDVSIPKHVEEVLDCAKSIV